MNKIIVIGNIGRDPEMKYTSAGQAVTNFSIASNRRYITNGEQRNETEWFNCSAWGRLAEIASQYLRKGQQVYVEGRLKSRSYTTQSGETRFSNDININELQMLGQNRDNSGQPAPAQTHASASASASASAGYDTSDQMLEPDDLPF